MAYSELIKSIDRIRDYMRQFYVYGFKSRSQYNEKSTRSYDNERRRIDSWMGDHMRFRQTAEGKNVFLSVDSRSSDKNPLHQAFAAKSFTDTDIVFHFYLMDLLADGEAFTAKQIEQAFFDRYFSVLQQDMVMDISTIRKKLKEYTTLGLIAASKNGREICYRLTSDSIDCNAWQDAIRFYTQSDPVGVIGTYFEDRLQDKTAHFRFKHNYILHAIDSQIVLQLLTAAKEHRQCTLHNVGRRSDKEGILHNVVPLKIYISTQSGRQYLLCYHAAFQKLNFFRIDRIRSVKIGEVCESYAQYQSMFDTIKPFIWGVSPGQHFKRQTLTMTVQFREDEQFIYQRLLREKRNGTVELLKPTTCRYTVNCLDPSEMMPWIRTFIGRIVSLECTDESVVRHFYDDLQLMHDLYGGED